MFEGFSHRQITTSEAVINLRLKGDGPPVLLLHGHPQTHVMWHRIAPQLANTYTVVCADLRGYGDSSKPPTTSDHAPYSKRAMARDQVEAMQALGFERFAVVGHDRGGRCAYRMALDHPERIVALSATDPALSAGAAEVAEAIPGLDEGAPAVTAEGVAMRELETSLRDGNDFAYIVSIERQPFDPCRFVSSLMNRVRWLAGLEERLDVALVPLIDTRRHVIVNAGTVGVVVDWYGDVVIVD